MPRQHLLHKPHDTVYEAFDRVGSTGPGSLAVGGEAGLSVLGGGCAGQRARELVEEKAEVVQVKAPFLPQQLLRECTQVFRLSMRTP